MADAAPTSVGSIVGYLTLDDSDWNEKLDAAQARADELGDSDPTIRIGVDDADAIAKVDELSARLDGLRGKTLNITTTTTSVGGARAGSASSAASTDAITAAETRLAAAVQASETATGRAQLAEMRLDQVRTARGRTDYQVASAEFAYSQAVQKSESAAEKAAAAEDALTAARSASADAENIGSDIVDDVSGGSGGSGGSSGGGESNPFTGGLYSPAGIAVAVGAVLSLAGPLSAAIVGLGGDFAGMGAAGVLAFLGIEKEMKSGSAEGVEFSQGLASLKSDLNELEGTAASGILGSFQQAEQEITADLPNLNSQIGVFTGMLGRSGDSLLDGVLNSLTTMNPLFDQAGQYVEGLAEDFDQWTEDGGLQKFVTYAEAELPIVEKGVDGLAKGLVGAAQALTPAGNAILGLLADFGDVGSAAGKAEQSISNVFTSAEDFSGSFKGNDLEAAKFTGAALGLGIYNPLAKEASQNSDDLGKSASTAASDVDKLTSSVGGLSAAQTAAQTAQQGFASSLQSSLQTAGAATSSFSLNSQQSLQQYAQSVANAVAAVQSETSNLAAIAPSLTSAGLQYVEGLGSAAAPALAEAVNLGPSNPAYQALVSSWNAAGAAAGTSFGKGIQAAPTPTIKPTVEGVSPSTFEQGSKNLPPLSSASKATTQTIPVIPELDESKVKAMDEELAKKVETPITPTLDAASEAKFEAQLKAKKGTIPVIPELDQASANKMLQQLGKKAETPVVPSLDEAKYKQVTEQLGKAQTTPVAPSLDASKVRQMFEQLGKQQETPVVPDLNEQQLLAMRKLISSGVSTAVTPTVSDIVLSKMRALLTQKQTVPVDVDVDTRGIQQQLNGARFTIPATVAAAPGSGHAQGGFAGVPHLAGGGEPDGFVSGPGSSFADMVSTMLSPTEFVVKSQSANAIPGFLPAYNQDPTKTLGSVFGAGMAAASQRQPVFNVYVTSNGVDLSKYIDVKIEAADQANYVSTGVAGY